MGTCGGKTHNVDYKGGKCGSGNLQGRKKEQRVIFMVGNQKDIASRLCPRGQEAELGRRERE